jgi:hypothetical protein
MSVHFICINDLVTLGLSYVINEAIMLKYLSQLFYFSFYIHKTLLFGKRLHYW